MDIRVTRRSLLGGASTLGLVGWAVPAPVSPLAGRQAEDAGLTDAFPSHDPAIVREVVGVSHGNYDRVKELVETRPELAKASWDWGFGDWESALGAAAHTGSRDIARLLIDHGARPTVFSAAMLGQLAVVRAFVEAEPRVPGLPGPHGIPLVAHARAGGDEARAVLEYLESLDPVEVGPETAAITNEELEPYTGTFRFGDGPRDRFELSIHERFGLRIERPGGSARALRHLGEHTFHPVGAASVRVRFELVGGQARALIVLDPDVLVRAVRAES